MIIAFAGNKQAGKDTASDVLVSKFGYTKLSFAKPLKDLVRQVFDLTEEEVNDPVLKESPLKNGSILITPEVIDKLLSKHAIPETDDIRKKMIEVGDGTIVFTPRQLLQYVGTDLFRNCASQTFWTDLMKGELKKHQKIVLADVRFKDERLLLRDTLSHGHKNYIFLIKRPNDDMVSKDGHSSENSLGDEATEYDYGLSNDGSKEDFEKLVTYIVTGLETTV